MPIEEFDAFMFEFDILCIIYNYNQDGHKLKLFSTTLKDYAPMWFMGLENYTILTWKIFFPCRKKKMKIWSILLKDSCITWKGLNMQD